MFFVLFIAIALFTVVLLEYIDFRKGKPSFIFNRLLRVTKTADNVQAFNNDFLRILNKNNIPCEHFQDQEQKFHFNLEVDAPRFDGLLNRMKGIATQLKGKVVLSEVQGMDGKTIMLYKISLGDEVTHLALITKAQKKIVKVAKKKEAGKDKKTEGPPPRVEEPVKKPADSAPRIAFIIDDVGVYDIGALELKRLSIPITASIISGSPGAREQAQWIEQYGLQSMIHLPMQPKNGNGKSYNHKRTVTMTSSTEDIRRMIRGARQIVPAARGLNNHQGSLATSSSEVMTRLMKVIKEEGLYFVDSRTIGSSVAYAVAQRMGVRSASKDVFLDHVQNYSHSISQIRRLVEVARYKGHAIAIGHPHQSTIKAIRDSLGYIRSRGIKIVFVSQLLN